MGGRDKYALSKLGPMIGFVLTEAAMVQFRITQKTSPASAFEVQGREGANVIRIPRRIRKSLGIGGHQITTMAIDSSDQSSEIERARFRVVR